MAINAKIVMHAMRLISFLGTGKYLETTYRFEDNTSKTKYVSFALASFTQPNEIYLLATKEAWDTHGTELSNELKTSGHPTPIQVPMPTGGEPKQLWEMFGTIVEVIRGSSHPVLLDITHGFRMQPFFAAACIQYIQSVLENPPPIRVVYGEYRPDDKESKIWELTPFLDVLSWSQNLMIFLQTGQADGVAAPTHALGRELNKQWASEGRKGDQPQLGRLAQALKAFSDDFTTIRTGSLLIGKTPTALGLQKAIISAKAEVEQHFPALAFALDQVSSMVAPLLCGEARLSSKKGQEALLALARLYQKMGRYSEAISITREGWITLSAPNNCDHPGSDQFSKEIRKEVEQQWSYQDGNPHPLTEVRNDIQHAGFRINPNVKKWFEDNLKSQLDTWENEINQMLN